jgi:hypothetical protein
MPASDPVMLRLQSWRELGPRPTSAEHFQEVVFGTICRRIQKLEQRLDQLETSSGGA